MAYAAWAGETTLYHGTFRSLAELGGSILRVGDARLRPQQPYQWLGDPPQRVPFGKPAVCLTPNVQFAIDRSLLHHENPVLSAQIAPGEAAILNGITTATGERFGFSGYDTVKALFTAWARRPRHESQFAFRPGVNGLVCFLDAQLGTRVEDYDPNEHRSYTPLPIKGYGVATPLDLSDDLLLVHGPRSTYVAFGEIANTVEGGIEELRDAARQNEIGVCMLREVREQWLS